MPDNRDELVESLNEQLSYLKAVIAARDEELRRKDHIIAAVTECIPELEPALESAPQPPDAREKAAEGEGKSQTQGEERRSWLSRFLFGP